jgi:AmmeMemoRadiSam system protein B
MLIRRPAVAGQFYPADQAVLRRMLRDWLGREAAGERALACIVPHAGYQYSGAVAASVYRAIEVPVRCVVLGPNHTGEGPRVSIMARGRWVTPLGEVPVDEAWASRLMQRCSWLTDDADAHRHEHSIEVQVPFLQILQPAMTLVPIVLYPIGWSGYRALGEALAALIAEDPTPTLLIASSDMTHYEPQEDAMRKDRAAVDAIEALDAEELCRRVERQRISMCGYAPASVAVIAAQRLGCRRGRLVQYRTSGETTGDMTSVVGYAGIILS